MNPCGTACARTPSGRLAGFRERMPPAELRKAVEAAADRLLREQLDLPRITFE